MRLAMPQIPRGRTNQFGNFMGVLEFRAIHLDDGARVAKEDFRSRLHNARLPRTCWPKKQQIPYRAAWRIQSGPKHLVQIHERLDTLFLPDDFPPQRGLEINRIRAALVGIEIKDVVAHDRLLANPRRRVRTAESPASAAKLV